MIIVLSIRYIQYNPTSLERSYKFDILADHDLGLNIDLVNKDKYTVDYNLQMDPADEKLLEEDILAPQDSKRYNCLWFSIFYKMSVQKIGRSLNVILTFNRSYNFNTVFCCIGLHKVMSMQNY